MRIALLSDIHGNLLALEAVLADLADQGPFDQIVVAGDLVWAGPQPAEVVDRVRGLGAVVLQGNTDAFFARSSDEIPSGKYGERFAAHLDWMLRQMGNERARYLAHLPFSYRISPAAGHELLAVHANPVDLDRAITPGMSDAELDTLLSETGSGWAALAFGHLHIPFDRVWRRRLLVDGASVGLPMDGDPRAAYAILSWGDGTWRAQHRRVLYDAEAVAEQMCAGKMPRGKHFAERLLAACYDD